ncbi:glycoside hydrolase family 16 protein [Dothidotthia symphoricarpi CBS 119687]|uniref:endo-1,3(4)-beta-glucanase n=1 Tax=Dothidotthia symphoricarpi CBS 119687 TaxID=1392245 RepID=A0A6A6AG70_9PLEO|nr:glycoside hydrolase family 16 protein [Dothidotthia symphoricarpi CBS 119687]KAF2130038.1 glycoside hydrolase family 16 protein [Dothidotthia symphoricarpi CBS 119687]
MRSPTSLTTMLSILPVLAFSHPTTLYKLTDDLSYTSFFSSFSFYSDADPTNGFVRYLSLPSAISQKLIGYLPDTQSVFLGVDYTTKDPLGRASVRLESKAHWNQGLLVADIIHMPSSECGVWPAYWLLGTDGKGGYEWPLHGEIDLLEGVNDQVGNAITLHTKTGCMVDNGTQMAGNSDVVDGSFSGFLTTDDCDVAAAGQEKNVGCSIKAPETTDDVQKSNTDVGSNLLPSYGTQFNKAGGGVYAMEWTESSISVWFFPRDSTAFNTHFGNETSSDDTLDPSTFGTPLAHFAGNGCDFTERFKNMRIIFDTTFCGEWAGKDWEKSCAAKTGVKTCEEYVRENPEVYKEAYWEIKGLKWYQKEKEAKRDAKVSFVKTKGRWYDDMGCKKKPVIRVYRHFVIHFLLWSCRSVRSEGNLINAGVEVLACSNRLWERLVAFTKCKTLLLNNIFLNYYSLNTLLGS